MTVSADPELAAAADGLVVPGSGRSRRDAWAGAIQGQRIIERRLAGGRPVLGVRGMQIMFEAGAEHGLVSPGCAQWPGRVERLTPLVLPHMGWNTVEPPDDSALFAGIADRRFYFVHSTRPALEIPDAGTQALHPAVLTWTTYGERFISAVENGPLSATQFHPEKSGQAGCNCSGTGSPRWPGDARRSSSQSQGISPDAMGIPGTTVC